jgi:PAS domain S-box-containing protein
MEEKNGKTENGHQASPGAGLFKLVAPPYQKTFGSHSETGPAEELLTKFNECFLDFGTDPAANINRLVRLCGELLGGVCALYNRLDGGMLCSVGQWNTPKDYSPVSPPAGHICYDVILQAGGQPLVIRDLGRTAYAQTDPNVRLYNLQTYIGQAVRFGEESIGSLCVVYQEDFLPAEKDLKLIGAIAAAIGIEENRRLAVQGLRESKERYQLLVETMNEGLALANSDYEFVFVNSRLCEMLGYSQEELLGHSLLEFTSDDSRDCFLEQMDRRRNGAAERYEVAWKGKNGDKVYTLVSPRGFYDAQGRFMGSLGVLTDINDRKRAEEALREAHGELERRVKQRTAQLVRANKNLLQQIQERLSSEEALKESETRYRLLAENVSDVIWTADLNLDITYVSPSIHHLLGLSPEETMELGLKKILTPASLEVALKTLAEEMILETQERGAMNRSHDHELELTRREGSPVWEDLDLKRSRTLELELIRKAGAPVWAEVRTTFLRDPEGQPVGLLGVCRDISKRKAAEVELVEHRAHLEKLVAERTSALTWANRQLTEEIQERQSAQEALKKSAEKIKLFAYSVSHDLKSPAIGIYGLTKLLSRQYRDNLDERGQNYCDLILRSAEQVAHLVEEINLYIATKEIPLKIRTVKLKEVVRTVREEFSLQLSQRHIKWRAPGELPEIRADKLSIIRALRNLIDNALKYGGNDLSEITIGYGISPGFLILSVKDDGVGLNLKDPKKLFGLFQRSKTSGGIEGSGLGLAIVKEIAERHGGKVWVESHRGQGTTFYFSIAMSD